MLYKRLAEEGVITAAEKAKTLAILRMNSVFIRCIEGCFEVCDVCTHSGPTNFSPITGIIAICMDSCLFNKNNSDLVSTSQFEQRILDFVGLPHRTNLGNDQKIDCSYRSSRCNPGYMGWPNKPYKRVTSWPARTFASNFA